MKDLTFLKLFLYYSFFILPFAILFGILSLLHKFPINFNDKPTYGIVGLVVCVAFTPFWAFLFSGMTWAALRIGKWLYTLFCSMLGIKVKKEERGIPF